MSYPFDADAERPIPGRLRREKLKPLSGRVETVWLRRCKCDRPRNLASVAGVCAKCGDAIPTEAEGPGVVEGAAPW